MKTQAAKPTQKTARSERAPLSFATPMAMMLPANDFVAQRKSCTCGGGCPRCQRAPQTKSAVSEPDDAVEREADAMAEQVLRMPTSGVANIAQAPVRTSSHLSHASVGQSLDSATRSFFEPRFKRDLSDIRIHTGPESALTAQAVSARAYTVGRDVVFGAGEYAPHSNAGRRLLAHELAHVVQQDTRPTQIMREPTTMEPSTLGPGELMSKMQETRDWLDEHSVVELDYGPMQDYLDALETEFNSRETPNVAPAVVNAAGQSIFMPWPPPREVCIAPSKIGEAMLPDDAMRLIINQRGFSSTAPRLETDALGNIVVTRPTLSPFDPSVFGKPLGSGIDTHALIRIYDAQGNIVAEELGAFFKKGAPHAELDAVTSLMPRIENIDLTGGKMEVFVDQFPCAGQCAPGLKGLAQQLKLKEFEVWLPFRESMKTPGVPASPKVSAQGAMLPDKPPTGGYLVEGVTFSPTHSTIQWPPVTFPPAPSTTSTGPLFPGWADDALKTDKTSPLFLNPNWAEEAFREYDPLKIPNVPEGAAPEFTLIPPKVPWYRAYGPAVGRFGVGLALGYASNQASLGILDNPDAPMSAKDKEAFSWGTAALPPGVDVAAAANARFQMEFIYEPVIKSFYEDSWNKYKEMNPDATPQEYNDDVRYWESCNTGYCDDF